MTNPIWMGVIFKALSTVRYCDSCNRWFKVAEHNQSSPALCPHCGRKVSPPPD